MLHRTFCAGYVNKIGMREAPWLAGLAVNRNANVNYVLDGSEQGVHVLVGHVECHVANEKSFGRGVRRCPIDRVSVTPGTVIDHDPTALIKLVVHFFHRLVGGGLALEFDPTESVGVERQHITH